MGVLAESPPIVLSDIPLDITNATWVRTLAEGGPLRSAVQGALPAWFVARLDRVVIVGEGGTGKSTLLKQMLALSAREGRIPVWLSLARLPSEGALTITALIEQLVEQARAQLGVEEVNRAFFEKAARDGLLAIGFDALDECGSLARRQRVRGLIQEVAREWKGCRIFVTSRSDALRETPLPMFSDSRSASDDKRDLFLGLTPLPFTRDDVTPFLEAALDDGEQLAQQLLARTGIEALLETPLTLMLVGLVARTSEGLLPAARTPLFAQCLATVVDTWEDAKSVPVVDGLDRYQRLDVLRRLGWEAQRSEEDVLDARVARAALLPALGNPARAKAAVDGLARRNLLLRAEAAGQGALDVRSIRFAHPQFREYLAGAHLAEQFALDATAAAAAMAPHWLDAGWLEVLRFAIATLEDDPELRDAFLRVALEALDPYADLLHRRELLVARLLARLPQADAGLVEGVVECLESVFLEEPALRNTAAELLLALAQHAPAWPAIERLALGGGAALALRDDEMQLDYEGLEALRWRLRAIEALASARGAHVALPFLPTELPPDLTAVLEVNGLRARLGDRDRAIAVWRQAFDEEDAHGRAPIAAAMDTAGEGGCFDAWLKGRLDADPTVGNARLAHERGILADDSPIWVHLFEQASEELAALDPDQDFAPGELSAVLYAATEVGAASAAARELMTTALRYRSLVWFAAPIIRKVAPEAAADAVRSLVAYVLDERREAPVARLTPDGRKVRIVGPTANESRVNVAVHTLCEEPNDALAVPALITLLRAMPQARWAGRVADALRRRGQAQAGMEALKPLLALPAGVDDRNTDGQGTARARAWQLAYTLDPAGALQQFDAQHRGGDPHEDARWLMQVSDVDHSSVDEHSDKPTATDAEREFESALDDDQYLRIDEMLGLLSSIDERFDPELVWSLANRWLQRALQDNARTPEQRADTLVALLYGLASEGLHDREWVPLVASFARTLAPDVRTGLLGWLVDNA